MSTALKFSNLVGSQGCNPAYNDANGETVLEWDYSTLIMHIRAYAKMYGFTLTMLEPHPTIG